MVELLLTHVSLDEHGEKVVTQMRFRGANQTIIQSIESATRNYTKDRRKVAAEPIVAASSDGGFRRIGDDTLEEVPDLSDGLTLTMLFNFSTRQQILVTKCADNSPSPATVVSFDALAQDIVDDRREKLDALKTRSEETLNNSGGRQTAQPAARTQ